MLTLHQTFLNHTTDIFLVCACYCFNLFPFFHISETYYFSYIYYMQSMIGFWFLTQSSVSLCKDIWLYPFCECWDVFLWFLFRIFWCYVFLRFCFYLFNKQFLFCVLHASLCMFGSVRTVGSLLLTVLLTLCSISPTSYCFIQWFL